MESRRYILFLSLSMLVIIGWTQVFVPIFFPGLVAPPAQQDVAQKEGEKDQAKEPEVDKANEKREPVVARRPVLAENQPEQPEVKPAENAEPDKPEFTKHAAKLITLGSLEPDSGYFLELKLGSIGAVVQSIRLNDPRYRELTNRDNPLNLVGNTQNNSLETLQTSIPEIDKYLLKEFQTTLNAVSWEVESREDDETGTTTAVTFKIDIPGKNLVIRKAYRVTKLTQIDNLAEQRKHDVAPYLIDFEISFEKGAGKKAEFAYELMGPVGLPLENMDNGRKFQDLRMGFIGDEGEIVDSQMTAAEVLEDIKAHEADDGHQVSSWTKPIQYIGVDVQYFAALLRPLGDQVQEPYISKSVPVLVEERAEETHSDISLVLTSNEITLADGEKLKHSYQLYAGPKRETLLEEPLKADDIMDYGWFGAVSKFMLWVLNVLHSKLFLPYGLAIIALTIMVRGLMFPLSKKQAVSAQKMKELQPEIAKLKQKYANDKEKLARAQMELFSKNNYNPFAGCLPILLQLPIFFGLYTALGTSVDLRMADFLWIDNLAAPDHLFPFPFRIPFLGNYFNLLPLLTIVMFVMQQKLFMPPATTPEEAMQHKMMNFMMIIFGFLFYHMPAGLCVYFIASSMWGIAERKLLDKYKQAAEQPEVDEGKQVKSFAENSRAGSRANRNGSGGKGNSSKKKSRR